MKKYILIVLASLIAALIVSEVLLRVFAPRLTIDTVPRPWLFPCFEKGTYYWLQLKKNAHCTLRSTAGAFAPVDVVTNSLGLRSPEVIVPKPANTIRILIIGDSFTFGWGVLEKESYPSLIEKIIQQRYPNKKIEVINAGLPASGPSYYYLFLKNIGIRLEPDIIVVGFHTFTDLVFDLPTSIWNQTDPEGLPLVIKKENAIIDTEGFIRADHLPFKLTIPILKHSHLFAFFLDFIDPHSNNLNSEQFLTDYGLYFKQTAHELDEPKRKAKLLFEAMQKLASQEHSRFIVMTIPAEFKIYPERLLKYSITLPMLPWDRTYPGDEFEDFFLSKNIDHLRLLPIFDAHNSEEMFYPLDDHWNPRGHQIAATAIAEKLVGIIDKQKGTP